MEVGKKRRRLPRFPSQSSVSGLRAASGTRAGTPAIAVAGRPPRWAGAWRRRSPPRRGSGVGCRRPVGAVRIYAAAVLARPIRGGASRRARALRRRRVPPPPPCCLRCTPGGARRVATHRRDGRTLSHRARIPPLDRGTCDTRRPLGNRPTPSTPPTGRGGGGHAPPSARRGPLAGAAARGAGAAAACAARPPRGRLRGGAPRALGCAPRAPSAAGWAARPRCVPCATARTARDVLNPRRPGPALCGSWTGLSGLDRPRARV